MGAFSLTFEAKRKIEQIIGSSGCVDPVVSLSDTALVDFPDEVKESLIDNASNCDEQEVHQLISNHIGEYEKSLSLVALAYERHECDPTDLVDVDGISFAMNLWMRKALSNHRLIYIEKKFMLESPDEIVSCISKIKPIRDWESKQV
jgi:hypothetical protein